MKNFKIIFIHGYTASAQADWYPNISKKLDELGIEYTIPNLPGRENPHAIKWLAKLHEIISQINKPLFFVGHSLGTRAALLYIEKYHPIVEKVFLIAAFANDIDNAKRKNKQYSDFFKYTIDLKKIKPFVKEFIVMHSKDDSDIPYQQGVLLAKDLGVDILTYEGRDHFSDPDNAEFVLEVLREKMRF